jgi:hypothetical protein
MTIKKKDTGTSKRKHYIALCGELALEEAVDPSYCRRQDKGINEWVNEVIVRVLLGHSALSR